MNEQKTIVGVFGPGARYWVGDGFPVRNLFPSNHVTDRVNPFLMLDYAGPAHFEPSTTPRGVGEHPHRGFETVTIAYQGSVDHRDSAGNSGTIHPGDVQWMTAASGVVHEEKHGREFTESGGTFEMVQLWVNLPKAHKMSPPRYQAIEKGQVPHAALPDGVEARVIAGSFHGVTGPARTVTPLTLVDVRLRPEAGPIEIAVPAGHNAALVLLRGNVRLNSGTTLEGEAQMAVLSPSGERLSLEAERESLLLLLTGEPIDEPVVSHGPFVMNTPEEIRQAMDDYRRGKMGRLR